MKTKDFLLCLVMIASMIVMPACNTKPDDDFSGNTVLVVMTKEASGVNKVHEKEIFGDVAKQIVGIEDLTYFNNPETALVNWENWSQILCLTLDKEDKKNVLRVVKYLNQLDVVHYAEPNYYVYPC